MKRGPRGKVERNAAVWAMRQQKPQPSYGDLAKIFGISRERVRQVCANAKKEAAR